MNLETHVAQRMTGFFVISLAGKLDAQTTDGCEAQINSVLAKHPKMLMFDLSRLEFVSSMGIRLILKTRKAIEKEGGQVVMANLQPQIQKVFEIVAALPKENIFANIEEADRYFGHIQQQVIEKDK